MSISKPRFVSSRIYTDSVRKGNQVCPETNRENKHVQGKREKGSFTSEELFDCGLHRAQVFFCFLQDGRKIQAEDRAPEFESMEQTVRAVISGSMGGYKRVAGQFQVPQTTLIFVSSATTDVTLPPISDVDAASSPLLVLTPAATTARPETSSCRPEEKLLELKEEIKKIKWTGLAEVRRKGKQCITLKSGHQLFYKEHENQTTGEVGLLINKKDTSKITQYKATSTRVITVDIQTYQ
ncbi:hypothetical protein ILUMI_27127 [Ignelater luminosus]|uniref:Uncharacterized protein n=1 Tax=Ignelater luminosus TaxID=2038154 RepID=A0A8K0C6R7_IGNLU|nr:hypothetical protein ILUMI_27127 [Ignelater luminosus]